jgi:very-short-patch-repair endonuclease
MSLLFNRRITVMRKDYLNDTSNAADSMLWTYLKNRQIMGYKFSKRTSLNSLSYFCEELKLEIEINRRNDIPQSKNKLTNGQELKDSGIHFLRFTNKQVQECMHGILEKILKKISELNEITVPALSNKFSPYNSNNS